MMDVHCWIPPLLLVLLAKGLDSLSCIICDSMSDENCAAAPALIAGQDCSKWCNDRAGFIPGTQRHQGKTGLLHDYPAVPCPYSGQFSTCRKISLTLSSSLSGTGNNLHRVMRSCGFIGNSTTQPDVTFKTSESSKREVYNCFTNNCNTGSALRSSLLTTAFLGLSLFFLQLLTPFSL